MDAILLGLLSNKASLGPDGKVLASQLPSYVEGVVEGYYYVGIMYEDESHTTPITPNKSNIYVDIPTQKTYRWSGTIYIEITSSLVIGEEEGTAYDGLKGKTNADNIVKLTEQTSALKEELAQTKESIQDTIKDLNVSKVVLKSGETLAFIEQADGKIGVDLQKISISQDQINDSSSEAEIAEMLAEVFD